MIDTTVFKKDDLEYIKVDSNLSHKFHWVIDYLKTKSKIFVKQITDSEKVNDNNQSKREWCIYDFLESTNFLPHTSSLIPQVIHFDRQKSVLIYKLTDNYISLRKHYSKDTMICNKLVFLVGKVLAKLHSETKESQRYLDSLTKINYFTQNKINDGIPYSEYMTNYLQPESLKKVPVHTWRFLGILHKSDTISKIIKELELENPYYCLTHNNLGFENIFISEKYQESQKNSENNDLNQNCLKITNWNAFSWGDPANDLGKIISNYFILWFDNMLIDSTIDIKQSIKLAHIPFKVINSSITTLIQAYVENNHQILKDYPDFLIRVIKFAGLGLIEQLLTDFKFKPDKALKQKNIYFYMASQLLCKPEKFLSI
ncbi:hypothetical protein [Hyella patelloides]|uniref:hypothetical protein n=1 Tax=Hyella patelloides TaxID=1982969 RepID=UPI0011A294F0|nr:hypothetical protein [Hyella patelloides]